MKTGICLNMIIKNEAKNLPRLFASLHAYIDFYVISDTGSTDNSIAFVKELGEKYGIDGIIESHAWVDFAHNRNIALDMVHESYKNRLHQCKWWLVFDPDEELIVHNVDFSKTLDARYSYLLPKQYNNFRSAPLLLISLAQENWRWKGAIHNYLENPSSNKATKVLDDVSIKCHVFEGHKSKAFANQREKSLRDAELLELELLNDHPNKINLHRYFDLANEYHEAKEIDKALLNFNLIVKHQSIAHSAMLYLTFIQLGNIYFQYFNDAATAFDAYLNAIKVDENRKEGYYFMAKIHFLKKEYEPAKKLLIEAAKKTIANLSAMVYNDIYTWRVNFDLLLVNIQLKKWEEAKLEIANLSVNKELPKEQKRILEVLEEKYFKSN